MKEMTSLPVNAQALEEIARVRTEPGDWLERRRAAWQQAETLNWPESKYTRFKGLDLQDFQTLIPATSFLPLLPPYLREVVRDERHSVVVQVNAEVALVRLSPEHREAGLEVLDFDVALRQKPELVARHFGGLIPPDEDRFVALVHALRSGGVWVQVPEGAELSTPVYLLQVVTEPRAAVFSPVVVVAGAKSRLDLVFETLSGPAAEPALVAGTQEFYVGPGARVGIHRLENWNLKTWVALHRRARLADRASVQWATAWLGGRLTYGRVHTLLAGDDTEAEDVQVFFASHRQHFDLSTLLDHQGLRTRGNVLAKGVLRDRARSVFYGMIKIEKNAQFADAYLADHSLILNRGAHADSVPGLEIEAHQVRATHGATVGRIDREKVFYLQTRGLSEDEARKTIVVGFLNPALERIPVATMRDHLQHLLEKRWAEGG